MDDAPRPLFADGACRGFLTVCALLTLVIGVSLRAWQIQSFMVADLDQLPNHNRTAPQVRQVVIVNPLFSFYGADLIQNDPFLRSNITYLYSHGPRQDAAMMALYYPGFHLIHEDRHGSIWSP